MFKVFTIFFLLIFSSLRAEVVNDVSISGNDRISDETIKVYGEFKDSLGQDLSKSDLDRILKNLYLTDFFENVSVEINNNTLSVDLKEYPVVNQLIIVGEITSPSGFVLRSYKTARRNLFSCKSKYEHLKCSKGEIAEIRWLPLNNPYNGLNANTYGLTDYTQRTHNILLHAINNNWLRV